MEGGKQIDVSVTYNLQNSASSTGCFFTKLFQKAMIGHDWPLSPVMLALLLALPGAVV